MSGSTLSETDWQVRTFVYTYWVERGQPPGVDDVARQFSLSNDESGRILQRLHRQHHIFLEPDGLQIRMANPLSAVETGYRVELERQSLWANCGWDSLGIPAMLGADASIEAQDPLSDDTFTYSVVGGQLTTPDLLMHFPLPVKFWYDDLVHT